MLLKTNLCFFILFCCYLTAFSQLLPVDSNRNISTVTNAILKTQNEKRYNVGNDKIFIYQKPKAFIFLTNLPKDAAGIAPAPFRKSSLKSLF